MAMCLRNENRTDRSPARVRWASLCEQLLNNLSLADWPYRLVWLACDHCPRRGQYRKETLIARFGGDVLPAPTVTTDRRAVS
jgi:hypothetical protein